MTNQSCKEKIRLLVVTPEYPPYAIGGGGQVVKTLTRNVAKKEQVLILSGKFKTTSINESIRQGTDLNTRVCWLPLFPDPYPTSPTATYMPPNLRSIIFLANTVFRGSFDLVHLHGFAHILVDLTAILCVLSKRRYVITVHGFPRVSSKSKILSFIYSIYSRSIGRFVLKKASTIVGVSKIVARSATEMGADSRKVKVIHNGLDVKPAHPKKGSFRAIYGISAEEPTILCIGRIIRQKGFQTAIRAHHNLLKEIRCAKLVIVGRDYGFKRNLERLAKELHIEDSVIFTGFLSEHRYQQALIDADVLVIPSLSEPFSLVALDGLAYGKPMVVSSNCGFAEVVGSKAVLLVNPQDIEQTKTAIAQILNDHGLSQRLSNNAMKESRKFGSNRMTSQYLQVYCDTIRDSHAN